MRTAERKPPTSVPYSAETHQAGATNTADEKHYSIAELAALWNLSRKTIRRIFEHEPGVLRWGKDETRFKRSYLTLRIPQSVAARVHRQLTKTG